MNQRPWVPYSGMEPPVSAGKITLEEFLDRFLDAWGVEYFQPRDLAFDADGESGKTFRSVIRFLGDLIQSSEITSYARPIGGGPVHAIDAALWEVDDFLPRFRANAFHPEAPFDLTSAPTHYLFVSEQEVEAFLEEWSRDPAVPTSADNATIPGQQRNRLLRLPEVLLLTGLSRSTMYAMIKRQTFPDSVKIGDRSAAWRHDEIIAWMAERRSGKIE